MEKDAFIKIAPDYYAAAIIVHLDREGDPVSQEDLSKEYSLKEDASLDIYYYLDRSEIFRKAFAKLESLLLVKVVNDPFGPAIILPVEGFHVKLQNLLADQDFPLYKYNLAKDGDAWLREALQSLDRTYLSLGITASDFDNPDVEWEPLPLDRNDPSLQKAIDAVDATIEQVRADNGYAANVPEEREYVLDGLSALSKRLKEATSISLGYIRKYALGPFGTLLNRFKDNALGLAASVAKEALRDWLRRKGVTFLDDLF